MISSWDVLTWKVRAVIILAVVAAVFVAGGLAGDRIGSLRSDARNAGAISKLHEDIAGRDKSILTLTESQSRLELSIADANKALAVAAAQTKAAEEMQRQAMAHAGELGKLSDVRLDKLAAVAAKASGCGEVLQKYWELRE